MAGEERGFIPILDNQALKEGLEGQKLSVDSAKLFIESTLVELSEHPLFFSNWWQQSLSEQLLGALSKNMDVGNFSSEFAKIRDHGRAVVSVLGMQAVDRNADANADNYGQFAPPKNMAAELHWDDGGEKYIRLKADPVVDFFLQTTFRTAFDNNNGWRVVQAFSGSNYDTQNDFLNEILDYTDLRNVKFTRDQLMAKGRIAMAMFEVDWMPEWIHYMNGSKKAFEEGIPGAVDVPWLSAFGDVAGVRNGTKIAKYDTYAMKGTLDADHNGIKTKIGYDHPRVLTPWDVAAGAKGSYRHRPEIVWEMQRLFQPLIDRRLANANGGWLRASGFDNENKPSTLDLYLKYGKMMNEILGGPQSPELDNLTNYDKILPALANFWGPGANGNPEFGLFLSKLFALKTEAMFFPGYKSNADQVLNSIRGLDVISGESEKQKALQGVLGEKGSFAHGWIAEVKRLYGIDLTAINSGTKKAVYPDFWNAYLRVFMDTPDLTEADSKYHVAINYINQRQTLNIVEGIFGIIKAATGTK